MWVKIYYTHGPDCSFHCQRVFYHIDDKCYTFETLHALENKVVAADEIKQMEIV